MSTPPSTAPTLTDGVVTLRAPGGPADIQGSWEQCQDPTSIAWTTVPVPYSHTDAVEFIAYLGAAWTAGEEWAFVVEYDGGFGGTVTLRPERPGRAELAYGSHPAVRGVKIEGRSVMERAVRILIAWGFAERDLHTISWYADVGNWASRRLAERVGVRVAPGVLPGFLPHRGEWRDAWVGTLLRGDPHEPAREWLTVPVLTGDRVRLRPHDPERDLPRIVEACRDPRTTHWLGTMPMPYAAEDARAWLESNTADRAAGHRVTWAVADADTDELIGAINVFGLDAETTAELGFWAHPDARGRGAVTEAVRLVLDHAFTTLELPVVRGAAAVENTASRHVLVQAGMHDRGVDRLRTRTRTGLVDAARYDLTREEWASAREL